MDADWDLFAVVRSCKSTVKKASSGEPSNRSSKGNTSGCNCLASLQLEEKYDPFTFRSMSRRASLQDSRQPLLKQPEPTTMGTDRGKNPIILSPGGGGASGQHHLLQQQQPQQQQQQQQQQRQRQRRSRQRVQQPKVPRTRKRNNQNMNRTVSHVTDDDPRSPSDQWTWRKYGRKPIKGSPYLRHYYKCSSSEECSARKHVERSSSEPDTYIVTYTDEHTHPEPKIRKSRAGGSRRKKLPKADNASSSSSISPTTPPSAPEDGATAPNVQNAGDNGVKEGENVNTVALETSPVAEYDDGEDIIMIPNARFYEYLFDGLGELVHGAGGGSGSSSGIGLGHSWPAFGGNLSSWGSCNSGSSAGSTAGRG
ncbi:hypothetical protein V6N13_021672 [Hibiscus sabdariffa]|uniref:WRKY domain-containing protein n=1 Tax=Hibiscus sabdariffa TaxID=183260 RepID=A0ABR2BAK4_9ROSI